MLQKNYRLFFFLFFIVLLCGPVNAQDISYLQLHVVPVPLKLKYRTSFPDTSMRAAEAQNILGLLQAKGYPFAYAENEELRHDTLFLTVRLHEKYEWHSLYPGNVPEEYLQYAGYRFRYFEHKTLNAPSLEKVMHGVLMYAENHGYPFATLRLDSLKFKDNTLSASLKLELNKQFMIDSIRLEGKRVISEKYISSYLGIKEGSVYNEQLIRAIPSKLAGLSFLSERAPSQVIFTQKGVELNIFPARRNANRFDGLFGILPPVNSGEKTQVVGQAHIVLLNAFSKGELMDAEFRSLQNKTRDLRLRFTYPYLFNTPFGLDLYLGVYKRDTSFLELNQDIGLQYLLPGLNYVKVFYKTNSSRLLSSAALATLTTLPEYADVTTNQYGLGFRFEKLDYRPNPRKGYTFNLVSSAGRKTVYKNPNINEALYDSIRLNTTLVRNDLKAEQYITLLPNHVLNLKLLSGLLLNDQLFRNELYRLGGIKDLRGFDEESIFASSFVIWNLEYRLIIDRNSYFSLFYNQAWYENRSRHTFITDTPYGFGTGLSFDTRAGIFTISYALGSQFGNPVNLQTGKVHFGIINYF